MRDLNKYYEKAKQIVEDSGFELPQNIEIGCLKTADSYENYGFSSVYKDKSVILVNKIFLNEQIPECGLISVLIHEIAHVLDGGEHGHGLEWQAIMHKILEKHPKYDDHSTIGPLFAGEDKLLGITPLAVYKSGYKDICYCPNCKSVWYRKKPGSKTLAMYIGLPCPHCGTKIIHYNPPMKLQNAVSI